MTKLVVAFIAVAMSSVVLGSNKTVKPVAYPEGYRDWSHVKSLAITSPTHPLFDPFGGLHHIYANGKALNALKGIAPYSDGATLVFDLFAAEDQEGVLREGPRKFIGVMVKNNKLYPATGGWGFEGFKGDSKTSRMVTDAETQCYTCHAAKESSAYVFSRYRK